MPNEQKVTRKLTAIMSADVKGYSLLMSDDEIHTIQTLKTYRQIMSEYIQQHTGRVVDSPGDNLLAEFGSVVDAVQCAVGIQKRLKKENDRFVEDKRLEFRIGVNVGDVVQDENSIYGSGVNVAARIEGLTDPGGVCISRNAYDHVKDKLGLGFEFFGEHEAKNIKEPIRVYKVLLESESPKPLVDEILELPTKPSIAILPFNNMSGDPSQEYFSDALTEQIISGMCKVKDLFVIARNSTFAYKRRLVSIKQIARELGVKYILEGSVQKAGNRIRITAQLIDATTDYHMWSDTYDRDLSDIFALQDEITMKLITAMGVNLTYGEQFHFFTQGLGNLHAFDKFMRGLEYFYRFNKQDNVQARLLFSQALKSDENSALIFSMLGYTHLFDISFNWSNSPLESFIEAEKYAQKALSIDELFDMPHSLLGFIHLVKKEYEQAILESKRAVDLNPNGADVIVHLAMVTSMIGEPEKGISLIKRALRLNPIPPSWYYQYLGVAYRMTDQNEKAKEVLNRCISIDPEAFVPYLSLTACYINLNDLKNAQRTAKKVLELDPAFSLDYHKNILPNKKQKEVDRYISALRKAGLPE